MAAMFSLGEIDTAGRNSHGGHDENAIADICASWGSLIIKVGCAGMAASTCPNGRVAVHH